MIRSFTWSMLAWFRHTLEETAQLGFASLQPRRFRWIHSLMQRIERGILVDRDATSPRGHFRLLRMIIEGRQTLRSRIGRVASQCVCGGIVDHQRRRRRRHDLPLLLFFSLRQGGLRMKKWSETIRTEEEERGAKRKRKRKRRKKNRDGINCIYAQTSDRHYRSIVVQCSQSLFNFL